MITDEDMKGMPNRLAVMLRQFDLSHPRSRRDRDGFVVPNPAREDQNPSVRITITEDRILICDRTGAKTDEILDKIEWAWRDLFIRPGEKAEFKDYLAVLNGGASGPTDPADIENIDLRHEVYSRAIELLTLSDGHADYLKARGISREEAERRGYRSLTWSGRSRLTRMLMETHRAVLPILPGWFKKADEFHMVKAVGLLIPCRTKEGKIAAFKVRQDHEQQRYLYLAGAGSPSVSNMIHFPLGWDRLPGTMGVTEGEVKADYGTINQPIPYIGVPGIGCWKMALPHLAGVRKVVITFDQFEDADDSSAAKESRANTGAMAAELQSRGIEVKRGKWVKA